MEAVFYPRLPNWMNKGVYVKEARFRRESCGRTWLNILRMGGEDTVKLMLTY